MVQPGRAVAGPARPGAADAFRLARRWFKDGRRIEMSELAAALDVNRATLFRWVGNRDTLLADIVWSVTDPTFRAAAAAARARRTRRGSERVAVTMGLFAASANEAPNFAVFLQREPERALRILTTRAGTFQQRMVAAVEELLHCEAAALDAPLPLPDLAYLLVRIAETFIYSNIITGAAPDSDKVEQATAVLLGARRHHPTRRESA